MGNRHVADFGRRLQIKDDDDSEVIRKQVSQTLYATGVVPFFKLMKFIEKVNDQSGDFYMGRRLRDNYRMTRDAGIARRLEQNGNSRIQKK